MRPRRSATALALCLAAVAGPRAAHAGPQEDVDYVAARINISLTASLDAPDWRKKYELATKNIADLKATLRRGGKLTWDPVAQHQRLLTGMLDERKREYQAYLDAQERLEQARKKQSRQTLNDIGGELIRQLNLIRPTKLAPVSAASTKNAKIIREDFRKLRGIDAAIKLLESYKKSIMPSIIAVRDRKHALAPLVAAAQALEAPSFEGICVGSFRGEASGSFKFTVTGVRVAGSISGSYKGDAVSGSFGGTVTADGGLRTTLTGSLADSRPGGKSYAFGGAIEGRIRGTLASGTWSGKNAFGAPHGTWSCARR